MRGSRPNLRAASAAASPCSCESASKAIPTRIEIDGQERDRLTVGRRERSTQRWLVPDRQEHVDLARRELAIVLFVAFDIRCLDVIEGKIPTFLIAEFGHPLEEICIKWGLSRQHTDKADAQHLWLELRTSREWPCSRRTADKRYELAPFHCPMPPVLPTERIAHLDTADCCIHPPGRNEMIAITPPKIFSKEVAQKQATPFPRQDLVTARNRFTPNFRGWRLDEFAIFARPPPRGGSHTPALTI